MTPQEIADQSVQRFLANDAWASTLDVTAGNVAPGDVTTHLTVTSTTLNGHGSAHGAVMFALADIAFAMACNSHEHDAVGRTCNIEYLAPAYEGDCLTARAVERARSGRGGIYDVAVTRDSDGQLLAEMRGHSREVSLRPGAS